MGREGRGLHPCQSLALGWGPLSRHLQAGLIVSAWGPLCGEGASLAGHRLVIICSLALIG